MIKLNFVTGLICGVSSTLAIAFIDQAFKSLGSVPPREELALATPTYADAKRLQPKVDERRSSALSVSGQQPSSENSLQVPPRYAKRYVAACDSICIAAIRSKFVDVEELSSRDWDVIKESGAELSKAIASDPEAIRALLDRIHYSNDHSEVDGLVTLIGLFPDDVALELIRDVASYSSIHKQVALRALSNLSMHSAEATREIENLLIGERDPKLIAAALSALETTDNYEFNDHTWRDLSSQFEYVEDHQLKGAILTALAKHGKGDMQTLTHNVVLGLSSDSRYLQQSSIDALGYLLSESDNEQLPNLDQIRSQIYTIANNVDASSSVRISALELLEESF